MKTVEDMDEKMWTNTKLSVNNEYYTYILDLSKKLSGARPALQVFKCLTQYTLEMCTVYMWIDKCSYLCLLLSFTNDI